MIAGQTVGAAMRDAVRRLTGEGVPNAQGDVRWLMADALETSRDRLILAELDELTETAANRFAAHILRRLGREPVARILGRRNFHGRDFKVTPYVLDPRPETEILVRHALAEPFSEILDLGTGSGCIALTLLAERPEAFAVATDISPDALHTAGANAASLGLLGRIHFEHSDWFESIGGTYDLIVSNPPYIAPDEILTLAPEVERCDPKIALFDTDDGLTAYRRIAAQAPAHLKPGGRLLVEIGSTQAEPVSALFQAAGLADIQVHPDLDGRDRVVAARSGHG